MKTFEKKPKMTTPPVRRGRIQVLPSFDPAAQIQRAQIRQVLRSPQVQAKLTIGQPNDKYEQEADRVADEVMRMPEPRLQRQVEPEEGEEETLQARFEHGGGISDIEPSLATEIQSLKGGGQPLSSSTRAFYEPQFGADFSAVRIHSDGSRADKLARSVNARAFTIGRDVVFAAGRYAPETVEGRRLLAHELTHVVQQNRSRIRGALDRQPAGPTLTLAQKALKAIDEFKKRTSASQAFPGLSRDTVANELKQRVARPSLINQSGLPLCGPVAFAYVWASRNILAYVKFAVDLFEKGKGKLGTREISPDDDLKSKTPSSYTWTAGLKPAQADWMVLSSIRDWENDVIDFEGGPTETYAGGTGEGDIIKWFRELGFSSVKDDVDRTFGDDVDDAKKVDKSVGPGNYILLCVDAHMIDRTMKKKGIGNHWVVLVGNFNFSKGRVAFRCYTWGGFRDVDMTEKKFNATYYGAIIATA